MVLKKITYQQRPNTNRREYFVRIGNNVLGHAWQDGHEYRTFNYGCRLYLTKDDGKETSILITGRTFDELDKKVKKAVYKYACSLVSC